MSVPRARSDADWERQVATEQHGREPAPEDSWPATAGKQPSLVDHYQDARSAHEGDAASEDTSSESPMFLVATADRID
ncbi:MULTISPECIES: hypothetical protein [Rhodococcus]|uniref:Uncharacterized protein n=1 Tax=Rhodococcus opacus RKJ300 = JCM 13270 TaxID=1165867 RepID=I0WIJ7_RHOOP|nr:MULTISPECIES: hypothetical protein [Rhodococcus]EID76213.1 hypothetical protein W59_26946 [Rhodococcus opacus RKJ300 = JCM 13270]QQZ14542.1 hypothetical protein GO592_33910 [Rhodococcus sp. 21391]